jgi:uncharacterized protein (DUF2147 family)
MPHIRQKIAETLRLLGIFIIVPGYVLVSQNAQGADVALSPEGLWTTVDDHSGAARAQVRIYRQGDAYFGRIEANLVPDEAEARCTSCKDERRDQPVVGMVILRDLKPEADGDGFDGGDILDPESGSVYRCALHLEDEGKRLNVRGYIGLSLFGRSQTWLRAD